MRSFSKLAIAVLCLTLGTGALSAKKEDKPSDPAKASDKKDAGKKSDKDKDKDKEKKGKDKTVKGKGGDATPGEPGKLSLPLVPGHDSKGLKIPYYDANGKLQMVFTIGIASRLDPDHVKMREMQIETFGDDGDPEMSIDLPESILDLNTRVVSSKTEVTIKRDDFEITGDSVEFNTETKQGTLVGNVHMYIYDLNDEDSSKSEEKAGE